MDLFLHDRDLRHERVKNWILSNLLKKICNGKLHFLCSEKAINFLMFLGGIEKNQWNEMG